MIDDAIAYLRRWFLGLECVEAFTSGVVGERNMVVTVVEKRMVLRAIGEQRTKDAKGDAEEDIGGVVILCDKI